MLEHWYHAHWKLIGALVRRDGKYNGKGTFINSDGSMFEGEWENGTENGQGTFTWSNGDKYVGEWKDGNWNGQGTFTWVDGRKNEGKWKDGKPWKTSEYD